MLLHPLCELLALLANVHEARPAFEQLEWVAHVVLVDLAAAVGGALLARALDVARPDAPLDRPQVRRVEHEAEGDDDGCDDGLEADVEGQRGRRRRLLRGAQGREGRRSVGLQGRVLVGRVAAVGGRVNCGEQAKGGSSWWREMHVAYAWARSRNPKVVVDFENQVISGIVRRLTWEVLFFSSVAIR